MCEVVPQYVWKREISPLPVNRKTTDEAKADEEDNSEVCCIIHGCSCCRALSVCSPHGQIPPTEPTMCPVH